ncbi:MAG: ABC transporter permease subunit [Armatimonadetes bacterium]|nr:ABC transporter permease subunit [Armatimonadota bacterium]
MPEPIADLSYRGYSGEHLSEKRRWLVVAKMAWRNAFKKRAFWVFSVFACWYYLVMIAFFYVIEQVGIARGSDVVTQLFGSISWKDQFLTGFTYSQIVWLSLGLLVGAGSIANDNGTNALLVYLSKPVRKVDYLLGKWAGLFLPLLVGMAVPTLFFYLYGVVNFREYGFVSQDSYLLVKVLAMILGAACFQASLILGVSSLFNQGRMAGAAYAACFFLLTFFSNLMWIAFLVAEGGRRGHRNGPLSEIASRLYYLSIDGLQIGWAKVVLGTDGSPPFGMPSRTPQIPAPPLLLALIPILLVSAGGMFLAWRRVRAVEVVK